MKNEVIEVLNKEHGKKVIEYWKSKGADVRGFSGNQTREDDSEFRFYGFINGEFNNYRRKSVYLYKAKIIELPTEPPKEEDTFPRVMLVSDDAVVWIQAVVEGLRDGYAFATIAYSSVEEYDADLKRGTVVPFYFWGHYKELSDEYKVSKAEIASRFGIPVDLIEIVD